MQLHYAQIILACWAIWGAYWVAAAFWSRAASVRRESKGSWLSWRLLTFAAWILLLAPVSAAGLATRLWPQSQILDPLGLGITVAGLLFAVWARLVLGSNWSSIVTVHAEHQLVQTGPYAFTRHPIYTGILAAALGTVLASGKLAALLGFICLFLAFHLKLQVEERFMRGRFGSAYDAYESKVKRLVPFIY